MHEEKQTPWIMTALWWDKVLMLLYFNIFPNNDIFSSLKVGQGVNLITCGNLRSWNLPLAFQGTEVFQKYQRNEILFFQGIKYFFFNFFKATQNVHNHIMGNQGAMQLLYQTGMSLAQQANCWSFPWPGTPTLRLWVAKRFSSFCLCSTRKSRAVIAVVIFLSEQIAWFDILSTVSCNCQAGEPFRGTAGSAALPSPASDTPLCPGEAPPWENTAAHHENPVATEIRSCWGEIWAP